MSDKVIDFSKNLINTASTNINTILMIGLYILVIVLIIILGFKLKKQVLTYNNMKKCDKLDIKDSDIDLINAEQKYNYSVETYFLKDIYKKADGTINYTVLQNDYINVFTKAINSIMNNKVEFTNNYDPLNNIESINLRFYIYCLKFAKYTEMYNTYLSDLDMDYVSLQINQYYPDFTKDDRYFINNKHIIEILKKAVLLYNINYKKIDNCIYYKKCE
jgi:hypothetical protein